MRAPEAPRSASLARVKGLVNAAGPGAERLHQHQPEDAEQSGAGRVIQ